MYVKIHAPTWMLGGYRDIRVYRDFAYGAKACYGSLYQPYLSSVQSWSARPIIWISLGLHAYLGLMVVLCFMPVALIEWVCGLASFCYFLVIGIRFIACLTPYPSDPPEDITLDWPSYTVFVPLYQEEKMVPQLVTVLGRLEYPADRLQIVFICEQDDRDTIMALQPFLKTPFFLHIVPAGGPRTKPNALNYALMRTQSTLICIFDAEDRPHRDQLKMAACGFAVHPDWEALQAPLKIYNIGSSFFSRQLAIEYANLFYIWVPFLSRFGCPFPLGGTSNHIRRSALHKTGGWDAYNVTEDADLSFRISLYGGKLGYISLPTDEEAVMTWKSWKQQRSRWMKGFMQTYNVHIRQAIKCQSGYSFRRFITLHLTLGVTLVSGFLHLPFMAILMGLLLYMAYGGESVMLPSFFLLCLFLGYGVGMLSAIVGVWRSGQPELLSDMGWIPVYWLLLFFPTWIAFFELFSRPFYWHKTEHGKSLKGTLCQIYC